jgi:hypothetical protein
MTTTRGTFIIEDAIMRQALADWQAADYRVRKAADGSAGLPAVRLAAAAPELPDSYMPETRGAAVIAELKQGCPEVSLIAISRLFNSGHERAQAALPCSRSPGRFADARDRCRSLGRRRLPAATTTVTGPAGGDLRGTML